MNTNIPDNRLRMMKNNKDLEKLDENSTDIF